MEETKPQRQRTSSSLNQVNPAMNAKSDDKLRQMMATKKSATGKPGGPPPKPQPTTRAQTLLQQRKREEIEKRKAEELQKEKEAKERHEIQTRVSNLCMHVVTLTLHTLLPAH